MLEFVKTAFRGFFEVILWINLILCVVGGGIIAHNFLWDSYHERGLHPVLGVLLGLIIGMLTNVVGGGFIATILNIDENLEIQNSYFRLFLKNQNIKLPKELEKETAGIENLKITTADEQKVCNGCGNMVKLNLKQCPNCGNRDFSQV